VLFTLLNEAYTSLIWQKQVQDRRENQEMCITMGEGLRTVTTDNLSVRKSSG
jgi:hypothetical protein